MNYIRLLLQNDTIVLKRWFQKEKASKFIVMISFFIIFILAAIATYGFSYIFFHSLAGYSEYGSSVAYYLLEAATILLFWFALCSNIASNITFLSYSDKIRDFLLTQPISPRILSGYFFLKSVFTNMAIFVAFLAPVMLAYAFAFGIFGIGFIIKFVMVSVILVLLSGCIGSLLSFKLVKYVRFGKVSTGIIAFVFFITVSYFMVQLIFPPALQQIYDAPSEQFYQLYYSLPLIKYPGIVTWIVDMLVSGISITSYILIFITGALAFFTLVYEERLFIPVLQGITGADNRNFNITHQHEKEMQSTRYPLLLKDWYSIVRNPSELGYGMFLLSLLMFFFLFLLKASGARGMNTGFRHNLTLFCFGWLMFFTISYLLRLVFPLMAREGKAAWYILTVPISKMKIIQSKIILAILLSAPLSFFAIVLWAVLPFTKEFYPEMVVISLTGITVLAVSQSLLGAVRPDYSEGANAEKVSTSLMGIVTLVYSGILTVIFTVLLSKIISG